MTCSFPYHSRLWSLSCLSLNLKLHCLILWWRMLFFCRFQDHFERKLPLIKSCFITKLNVIMWFATKGHCLYFPMDSVHIRFPGIRRPSLYPDYKDYTIYISIYCVYYKYTDLYKSIREAARIITVFTRHILLREIHSVNTINTVSLVIYNTVIVCWTCMAAQCYVSFNCSHLLKHP